MKKQFLSGLIVLCVIVAMASYVSIFIEFYPILAIKIFFGSSLTLLIAVGVKFAMVDLRDNAPWL